MSTQDNNDFSVFLADFKTQTFFELDQAADVLIQKIKNGADILRFTRVFFEVLIKDFDFVAYARLAQLIEMKLKKSNTALSFIDKLGFLLWSQWISILPLRTIKGNADLRDAKALVKIMGEFYKVNCIKSYQIFQMMNTLANNGNFLESLRILVQIVSTTFKGKEELEMSRQLLQKFEAKEKTNLKARDALIYKDLIENFERIVGDRHTSQSKISRKQFESMFSNLESEFIPAVAKVIESIQLEEVEDIEMVVDILVSNASKTSDNSRIFSHLASKLQDLSVKTIGSLDVSFRTLLVEKCKDTLVNNLNEEIQLHQLSQTLNMFEFISELFLRKVVDSQLVFMCLQLIELDESNNAADCLYLLMSKTGLEIEKENPEKMDELFQTIKRLDKKALELSYRSSIYKQLIELRKNDWLESGDVHNSYDDKLFDEASNFPTSPNVEHYEEIIWEHHEDFVRQIWDRIIHNSSQVKFIAKQCEKVIRQQETKKFHDYLIEFFKCRAMNFASVNLQEYSIATRNQIENVMLFICEFYLLDIATDADMESLLKPAEKMEFQTINKLVAVINPKIGKSSNSRLKAYVTSLETIAHQQFMAFLRRTKEEIGEISKTIGSN